jgi:hypothetical protein
MMSLRSMVLLGLLLVVMISKHVVILTEETLVALCFGSFVYFCWYAFGGTIAGALTDHAQAVHQGVGHALAVKEAVCRHQLLEAQEGCASAHHLTSLRGATTLWWRRLHAMAPRREAHARVAQVLSHLGALHQLQRTQTHGLQEALAQGIPRLVHVDLPQEPLGIDQAIAVLARATP